MNPSGNGLGLHLSRKICRALGGDLIVLSNSEQGSAFTMIINTKSKKYNKKKLKFQSTLSSTIENKLDDILLNQQKEVNFNYMIDDK